MAWEPNFGAPDFSIVTPEGGVMGTAQMPIGTTQDSIIYQDYAGNLAELPDLTPVEVEVLRIKHDL